MSLFYGPCLMLYWNDLLQSPVKAFFLSNSISRLRHLRSCLLFQAVVSRHQIVVLTIFTRVRKHVVQKGDTVIDATCGNGYDTFVMVNMLADELARVVFDAMDIQNDALQNISSLLEELLDPNEVPFSHGSICYFNYVC